MRAFHLGYRPGLDGLRGIAIVMVMGTHFRVPGLAGGFLGVDVFFVLSGFLITSMLLEEWQASRKIDLGRFYLRRILRLWPGLFAMLAFCSVLALGLAARGVHILSVTDVVSVLLYFANWVIVLTPDDLGPLAHTWSLGIEEQFYLLWPITLIALLRWLKPSRWLFAIPLSLAVMSWAWRVILLVSGAQAKRMLFASDAHADGILLGCALAAIIVTSGAWPTRLQQAIRLGSIVVLAPALLFVARSSWVNDGAVYLLGIGLVNIATVGFICQVLMAPQSLVGRILAFAPLVEVGRLSYSLYLWHVPVYWLLENLTNPTTTWSPAAQIALRIALSLMFALISRRYVELPFLRLKERSAKPVQPRIADSGAAVKVPV